MPDTIRTVGAFATPSQVTSVPTISGQPGVAQAGVVMAPGGLDAQELSSVQDATDRNVPGTICSRSSDGECAFTTVYCDSIGTDTIFSTSGLAYVDFATNGEIVFKAQPRPGGGAREISGYSFILGDLIPSEGYKGGYIVGKDLDGNLMFDWQLFGSGSPTGFLYWREAYNSVGWRVQLLSGAAGEGFVMESFNGADIQFDLTNSGASGFFYLNGGGVILQATGDNKLGFWGASPISKPTVTGAKGGNAALTSLLTQLANLGLIVDSTT